MTIVEKAAYLKGLTEGLGISPDSKEGKLWGALNELLSDMAHEIEDLQASNLDFAEALDDISEDLTYLEELTCDLDMPEDMMDEESCSGDCSSCLLDCGVPIHLPHTTTTMDGCTIHNVDNGALMACFDEHIPHSVIRAMAAEAPLQVIFRDSAFAADADKINVTEIFKNLSPDTKVRVI